MNVLNIARVAYEANRAWCVANGDLSQKSWDDIPVARREAYLAGVLFRMHNPDATQSAQHDRWLAEHEAKGWSYGRIRDEMKKEHPCMLPYDELPEFQRKKDALFVAVVKALV